MSTALHFLTTQVQSLWSYPSFVEQQADSHRSDSYVNHAFEEKGPLIATCYLAHPGLIRSLQRTNKAAAEVLGMILFQRFYYPELSGKQFRANASTRERASAYVIFLAQSLIVKPSSLVNKKSLFPGRKMRTRFCISRATRVPCLHSNQSVNRRRKLIPVSRLI